MAGRRKITIQEAMQTLEAAGLHVSIDRVDDPEPQKPKAKKGFTNPTMKGRAERVASHTVRVELYAKHCVGQGGVLGPDGQGYISEAGVQTYGPGIVTVPARMAQHLLHQDMLARQQDERFLDRTQRSYLVQQLQAPDGSRATVGRLVDNEMLDGFDLNKPIGVIVR